MIFRVQMRGSAESDFCSFLLYHKMWHYVYVCLSFLLYFALYTVWTYMFLDCLYISACRKRRYSNNEPTHYITPAKFLSVQNGDVVNVTLQL